MVLPKEESLRNVLSSRRLERYPLTESVVRDFEYRTRKLPVCGARLNGRFPTSGENAPIGISGNAGLNEGKRASLEKERFTTASRYVYVARALKPWPMSKLSSVSAPRARVSSEFPVAPKGVCAATGSGTPSCGSAVLLTNSTWSLKQLWKKVSPSLPRPFPKPCSTPASKLRERTAPMGLT